MKTITSYLLFLIILSSCNEENEENYMDLNQDHIENNFEINEKLMSYNKTTKSKKVKQFIYSCDVINSLDFLKKQNKTISSQDIEALKNESVVILNIATNNFKKEIKENASMSNDEMNQYLLEKVNEDLWIVQNKNTLRPTASNCEMMTIKSNQIRIYFYFKGLKENEYFELNYYDKLFGSGIVKYTYNKSV